MARKAGLSERKQASSTVRSAKIFRVLFQISDTQVTAGRDRSAVGRIFACENIQQGRFTGTVAPDQSDAAPLADRERDIVEKHQIAVRLGQIFDLEVVDHSLCVGLDGQFLFAFIQ